MPCLVEDVIEAAVWIKKGNELRFQRRRDKPPMKSFDTIKQFKKNEKQLRELV